MIHERGGETAEAPRPQGRKRSPRPLRPLRSLRLCGFSLLALLGAACGHSSAPSPPAGRTCVIAPPAPSDWRLRADGTKLRDALGRVVFLRGVDAGGRSKFAPYVPFDYAQGQYATALASYMDRAASWGIDAMRVPFTWAALEPTQGAYDQDWLGRYDQLLDAAWSRGIWTVVDFHQDVYAELFCGDGFPAWTISGTPAMHTCPSAQWELEYLQDKDVQGAFDRFWGSPSSPSSVQTAYLAAWDVMLARYKDKHGVIGFEPINEPGWGSQDVGAFEAKTLSPFYTRVATHFRAMAPASLVFCDATGLAGLTVTTTLTDPGVDGTVFAPHYYPPGAASPDQIVADLGKWAAVGAAWNRPVFVGEFGTGHDNPSAADYMTAHFAGLDQLGLGGTEWEYSVESVEWNGETNSVVGADGTEYPVAQALVRPFARAVAGDAIVQSWDPVASTFTLSYAPSAGPGGVTEVSLPARAFPSGYAVELDGACYDTTSMPGRMLVQSDSGATQVKLTVTR
jgi:endoglycosylceramidase